MSKAFDSYLQRLLEPSMQAFLGATPNVQGESTPSTYAPADDEVRSELAGRGGVGRTGKAKLRAPLCIVCLMVGSAAAVAQSPATLPGPDSDMRDAVRLEQMSHEQLKVLYVGCSNEAAQRVLGAAEASACSLVYETLKRRVFGGDFTALLAWSRSQPAAQPDARGGSIGRAVIVH